MNLTRVASSSLAAASRLFRARLPPPSPSPQSTTHDVGNNSLTATMPCRRLSSAGFSVGVGGGEEGGVGGGASKSANARGFSLQKKYGFRGGDYNNITLVGSVTKVTEKTSVKAATSKPYVVIQVRTLFRYRDTASGEFVTQLSRHTVIAFTVYARNIARHLKVGDRVFVSGRMEYYLSNGSRTSSIQAEKIIPMAGAGDSVDDAAQPQDGELAEEDDDSAANQDHFNAANEPGH